MKEPRRAADCSPDDNPLIGEFGRTPTINPQGPRPLSRCLTCVFAGGGIKGGQAYGKTSDSGEEVTEDKVDVPTSSPPSLPPSASIPKRKTSPSKAGRSRSRKER
jgi:hypothetical protein